MRDGPRRVVVTGIGVVCALGVGRQEVWANALAGTPGGGPIRAFDTGGFDVTMACEATSFDAERFVDRRVARRADRATLFALAAAHMAAEDADFRVEGDGHEVGSVFATGTGGNTVRDENHRTMLERSPDRISPFAIPHSMGNVPAAQIAMDMGIRGPVFAPVTACAAGTDAIGTAAAVIRRGDADVIVAGGTDAMVTPFWLAAFTALRVLSHRNEDPAHAARPFDAHRDGFLIGEGSAALILEDADRARARGATIICELAGYGSSADAHHITDPDPTGRSQARAMRWAIREAGIEPSEIDYVNAHGGASQPGDPSEITAIRLALGDDVAARTAVSATKSMHGHCMGATGAIEGALTAMAVQAGRVPPTISLTEVDPECEGVDHVRDAARDVPLRAALSTNNGLGGHNAAVVFRAWEDA